MGKINFSDSEGDFWKIKLNLESIIIKCNNILNISIN